MTLRFSAILIALPGILAAQAAVEYSSLAAMGAGAAAAARSTGKAVAAAMEKTSDALQSAPAPSTASRPAAKTAAAKPVPAKPAAPTADEATPAPAPAPPPPAPAFEDPSGIQQGMPYAEMIQRFGPPSMKMTADNGETLYYFKKDGRIEVTIRDAKVAALQK